VFGKVFGVKGKVEKRISGPLFGEEEVAPAWQKLAGGYPSIPTGQRRAPQAGPGDGKTRGLAGARVCSPWGFSAR